MKLSRLRSPGMARSAALTVLLLLGTSLSWATLVPRLTVEQMVDESASVVEGTVLRKWAAWDGAHQFIWTHYEIEVTDILKGVVGSTVTVSEPGGEVGGMHMSIASVPTYEVGEQVVILLSPTEIGFFRTCGWGQGKFSVETASGQKTVSAPGFGAQIVDMPSKNGEKSIGTARKSLDGLSLSDFKSRLRELIQSRADKGGR